MTLFFDSSSLVKRYLDEVGSETMRRLFRDRRPGDDFFISDHIGLEVLVRLHKFGRVHRRAARAVYRYGLQQFAADRDVHLNVLKQDLQLFKEAEVLAERFADSGAGTLDLIHLASAFQVERSVPNPPMVFVASDRKLKHVAVRAGLNIFDPEHMRFDDLGL